VADSGAGRSVVELAQSSLSPVEERDVHSDRIEWKQISRAELYRMAYAGKIPVTRIGGMLRFPKDRLKVWVDARTEG
jgi:excisionase family DNA binding protein